MKFLYPHRNVLLHINARRQDVELAPLPGDFEDVKEDSARMIGFKYG